jgi:hypothetical protein
MKTYCENGEKFIMRRTLGLRLNRQFQRGNDIWWQATVDTKIFMWIVMNYYLYFQVHPKITD